MIEKILNWLTEMEAFHKRDWENYDNEHDWGAMCAYKRVKEKVQEVAKEYGKDTNVRSNGWIPCSERLPEEKVDVLICYKDIECNVEETGIAISNYREITFGGRPTGYKNWIAPFSYFHQNYEVIAWKPLPAPYQKGE